MIGTWHRCWRFASLALVVVGLYVLYSLRPRDLGRELRLATYKGDLAQVESLLRLHPGLVDQACTTPPNPLSQSGPRGTSFFEELTMFVWEKVILMPIAESDDNEFLHLEMAQLSPLAIAIVQEDRAMVAHLLERRADVNLASSHGQLPLSLASHNPEIIRLLLKHGADVHQTNRIYGAPLHRAIYHPDSLRILLDAGADPNAQNAQGMTPAHFLAMHRHFTMTNAWWLLLERGGRLDVTNRSGDTPLDIARKRKNTDAVDLISHWEKTRSTNQPPRP